MKFNVHDSETFLISPGRQAPKSVCWVFDAAGQDELLHSKFHRDAVLDRIYRTYTDGYAVGAYTAFDACVAMADMPELSECIWKAYDELRVLDVLVNEKLIDLANGRLGWRFTREGPQKIKYNLADTVLRRFKFEMDKDTWRLKYGTLIDTPLERWDPGAAKYPLDDLRWTREVLHEQLKEPPACLIDAARQARASFWLTLVTNRGFALDREWIDRLDADLRAEEKRLIEGDPVALRKAAEDYTDANRAFELGAAGAEEARLQAHREYERAHGLARLGLVKPGKGGWTRDTKVAGARLDAVWGNRPKPEVDLYEQDGNGDEAPTTTDGKIALTKEVCRDSGDLVMKDYSRLTEIIVTLAKVASLKEAAAANMPIQSMFDSLLESGRTSVSGGRVKKSEIANRRSFGFQIQNVKTEPGLRECFVPREGYLLWSIDYGQLELCTWAQACMYLFGFSKLGEMLNAKQDVHSMMGAKIFGLEYDWVTKNRKTDPKAKKARDCGKPFVFAKPGGMGDRGVQRFAAGPKYNVHLTPEEAHKYGQDWEQLFPEHKPYFDYVRRCLARDGGVMQLISNRFRGVDKFPAACNTIFQGLAADTAKAALYEVSRACYTGRDSRGNRYPALHGSYVVNFVHDEAIGESPKDRASEACQEAASIMKSVAQEWLPHVPPDAEPCLMERWYKEATIVRGEDGRIKAWAPKAKAA